MTLLHEGNLRLLLMIHLETKTRKWAPINAANWALVEHLPDGLVERKPAKDGGKARLTERGEAVARERWPGK